ncbi:MAG: dehydrogenase [Candidatus Hydrogenedentota bacterium]
MRCLKPTSRRTFLKTSLAAAAPVLIDTPAPIRGEAHFSPPNPVRVGYIGVGRRAAQLMKLPDSAVITAFSDLNPERLSTMHKKYPATKTFLDYREMITSGEVDAVVVATPDHWHALPAIHACQEGKHVYVEKPLSLTVAEGRAMVTAARKYGVTFQCGSQQRSMKSCQTGCHIVREGLLGKIATIHGANYPSPWDCDLPEESPPADLNWDMWCGQTTPRGYHRDLYLPRADGRTYKDGRPLGWISYTPYSGGEMTGWGAHGLDIVQWALGKDLSGPVEVWPEPDAVAESAVFFGKRFDPKKWPEGKKLICPVSFRYDDGTILRLDGKGPGGGALFEGEKGTILIDRGQYKYTLADGTTKEESEPKGEDDTKAHLANWIDAIRNQTPPAADVEMGHRSATVCHLGNIARWTGRKLQWDPAAEQFVNDDEANAYLKREMRKPWAIEEG